MEYIKTLYENELRIFYGFFLFTSLDQFKSHTCLIISSHWLPSAKPKHFRQSVGHNATAFPRNQAILWAPEFQEVIFRHTRRSNLSNFCRNHVHSLRQKHHLLRLYLHLEINIIIDVIGGQSINKV